MYFICKSDVILYHLALILKVCSFLFLFHVHHQYKYQINIDGTVAAYRLPYLLAGDSVVLKQDSAYYEHFYNELRAWEHYIPIRADLGDLLEKVQWARDHDEEVMVIITVDMHYILVNSMMFGINIFIGFLLTSLRINITE